MHWATQFPGGVLAKKYGTKLVFGLGNVIACWMCFIAPMLARWDYRALIIFRVLQGFVIVSCSSFKYPINITMPFPGCCMAINAQHDRTMDTTK